MVEKLQKASLPLLTVYAVAVAVWAALNWDELALTQQLAAIATVIVTCHEWEEQRFPGGFLELMGSILGLTRPAWIRTGCTRNRTCSSSS